MQWNRSIPYDTLQTRVNEASSTEIARYDLSEDASIEKAMIFGEIYRVGGVWKFN